jgi:hypothetical protein
LKPATARRNLTVRESSVPGGTAMRDYRAYVIGPDGHFMKRFDFWCQDDEAAKDCAKQLVDGHDVELWRQDQKIAEFKSK